MEKHAATPLTVELGTIPHPAIRLRRPIHLEIEREGDQVGAWAPALEEFGAGPYLSAAIADLQQVLIELYLALADDAAHDRLSTATADTWNRLQTYIEPRG